MSIFLNAIKSAIVLKVELSNLPTVLFGLVLKCALPTSDILRIARDEDGVSEMG